MVQPQQAVRSIAGAAGALSALLNAQVPQYLYLKPTLSTASVQVKYNNAFHPANWPPVLLIFLLMSTGEETK